jgi:hypothetical protein
MTNHFNDANRRRWDAGSTSWARRADTRGVWKRCHLDPTLALHSTELKWLENVGGKNVPALPAMPNRGFVRSLLRHLESSRVRQSAALIWPACSARVAPLIAIRWRTQSFIGKPRLLGRPNSLAGIFLRVAALSTAILGVDAIFGGYAQDEEVTRYLIWRPHRSHSETRAKPTDRSCRICTSG